MNDHRKSDNNVLFVVGAKFVPLLADSKERLEIGLHLFGMNVVKLRTHMLEWEAKFSVPPYMEEFLED